jgi:transposase-like protein
MLICPKCGSSRVVKLGFIPTIHGEKQRYRCHKGHTFYAKKDYKR